MNNISAVSGLMKLLNFQDSQVWEFPKMHDRDDSIVKYDTKIIDEDHHGMGTLENADRFHFTTKNEDLWFLPSESYLLVKCRLRKEDNTAYRWADVAAQVGPPVVPAQAAEVVTIDDNAFNIFKEARYLIDDQKVESIEYLGISTLVDNIFTYNDDVKEKNARHSQLWFRNDDAARMTYVRECQGTLQLLLPLSRIFPFCKYAKHVFRGVKHRIEFTLNDANNLVYRGAGVENGRVKVLEMRWVVPYVEPSLTMMAKLETQLATNSTFEINWPAINVFQHQPAQNQKLRIPLNATVHKPTKIVVITQNLNRTTSQEHNSLEFDHLDLTECFVEINGVKYPETPIKTDFDERDIQTAYHNFLKFCDNGVSCVNMEMFRAYYPLMCIDVSQHPPQLYENSSFPNIVINMEFENAPANDFLVWVIVYNDRQAKFMLDQKKTRVIM